LLDREKALLHTHLTVPVARRALCRLGAGLRARAFARLALFHRRNADARLGAARGVLERDLEVVAKVGTPKHGGARAPAAEDVAENVAESVGEPAEPGAGAGRRRVYACVTVLVVGRALPGIGENFVGFLRLLEALFGLGVIGVAIGMVLHRELAIGLLEVILGRIACDAEHLVIISFCHGSLVPEFHRVSGK
jgi:hypothetical protein